MLVLNFHAINALLFLITYFLLFIPPLPFLFLRLYLITVNDSDWNLWTISRQDVSFASSSSTFASTTWHHFFVMQILSLLSSKTRLEALKQEGLVTHSVISLWKGTYRAPVLCECNLILLCLCAYMHINFSHTVLLACFASQSVIRSCEFGCRRKMLLFYFSVSYWACICNCCVIYTLRL